MSKAILMSILVATFWIPLAFSGDPNPKRAVRKVRRWFAGYCVVYVILILYVMSHV